MISNKTSQIENIGIDIVDIERFRKRNFSKNERFYEKIFTSLEIDYCRKFHDPYPHFAGKFALKEAVMKSIHEKLVFKNIETFHINSKPEIKLTNQKNNYKFHVSISHENRYAIAIVIALKN